MLDVLSSSLKSIFIVMALTILGAILIVDLYLHKSLEAEAIHAWDSKNISHLEDISRLIDQQLSDALSDLKFVSKHPEMEKLPYVASIDVLLNGLPEQIDSEKRQLLNTFLLNNKRFSVMFVLTSEGDHYISHPFSVQLSLKKFNLADRPYIQEAQRTKQSVISNRFVGAEGVPVVVMAVPLLTEKNSIFGYLGGVFHLKDVSGLLLSRHHDPGHTYFLVDRLGQVIAQSGQATADNSQDQSIRHPLVKSFLRRSTQNNQKTTPQFVNYYCDHHDKECRGAYYVLESGWGLLVEKSQDSFMKEVSSKTGKTVAMVAIILLVLGLLAMLLLRRISFRLRKAQVELQETQSELIQSERLSTLGRLTATVSHELRNPLGTVRTAVFSIEDNLKRNQPQHVERALELAERNIQRCVNIIEELTSYTRVKKLDITKTSIDDWLQAILDEQTIPEEIRCELNFSGNIRAPIDPEKLRQVIVNLISNALHALLDEHSNGKLLQISTHLLDTEYEIRVRDNGIGMSDETKEKVFEPLYSTKGFGVGLGMIIAKGIVEQHHGKIRLESQEGAGTTVSLRLPIDF
jgi:signal transduction histidine kinase